MCNSVCSIRTNWGSYESSNRHSGEHQRHLSCGRSCQLLNQVRIQDLVKGGPQLLRPKVADVAKRSHASEASILWLGSRARLRALEAFGFLMLKYAFSHILENLFLLFLTSILTPKVDKNRALDFTSINLKHSDMLHLFLIFMKKLCFNWMTWGMLSKARLKILWHGWWKIDQLCDW